MSAGVPHTLLEEALDLWRFTRDGVIAETEAIPEEQFDFSPAPGARTLAEIVQHIAASAAMSADELTRPDGDFQRLPPEELVADHVNRVQAASSRVDLLTLLRTTHDEGERLLRAAGEVAMLQRIRRFDGQYSTRLAWLWHLIDHESYHRGQIALYARLMGRTPALTRLIHGA